jgi:hypothetical protein
MRFDPDEFRPVALEDYRALLNDYVAWLWVNFYQRIFPEWTAAQQARARDIDELPDNLRNVLTGILTGLSTFTADMLEVEVSQARSSIEERFPGLIDSLAEWGPIVLRDFREVSVTVEPQVAAIDETEPYVSGERLVAVVDEKREGKAAKSKAKEAKRDKKRRKEEEKRLKKRAKKDKKRKNDKA